MRWETIPGGGLTSQYWLLSHYMRIYIDSGSCFKDVKPHYITERTQKVKKVPILLQRHWVPILKVWGPHFECLRSPLKLWAVLSTILTSVSLISLFPMSNWSTDPSQGRHSWTQGSEIFYHCKLDTWQLVNSSTFKLVNFKLVSFTACASWSLRACFTWRVPWAQDCPEPTKNHVLSTLDPSHCISPA